MQSEEVEQDVRWVGGWHAEGDDADFTYECQGLEYYTLSATAVVLCLFILSIVVLARALEARQKLQEAFLVDMTAAGERPSEPSEQEPHVLPDMTERPSEATEQEPHTEATKV